jgi:hypothetical protein
MKGESDMPRYIDADKLWNDRPHVTPEKSMGYKAGFSECMWAFSKLIREQIDNSTADVAPRSEKGAECPTCYGTGRIGTTDWLTRGISKKRLAEEKAKAIAEHEQHIKSEVAREIFGDLEASFYGDGVHYMLTQADYYELKKQYTEGKE